MPARADVLRKVTAKEASFLVRGEQKLEIKLRTQQTEAVGTNDTVRSRHWNQRLRLVRINAVQ